MARAVATFHTARKLARELGAPGKIDDSPEAIKIDGKLVAWIPPRSKKHVDPGTMAVRVPIEQRDGMIVDAPEIYYVTEHYLSYPAVLVRLARIETDALRDLLSAAVAHARTTPKVRRQRNR